MLMSPPLEFAYNTSSLDADNPAIAPGIAVTTGASNADGTAVSLIGTPLTHDAEMLEVFIHSNNTAATITSTLLDLLIDPAGGTSWADLIQSLPAGFLGNEGAGTRLGRHWMFPLWIPAGATIGARGRNVTGSTRAVTACVWVRGGVRQPGHYWCGTKVDPIGDDRAGSSGISITPSATANTFGSWTNIGSVTAREYQALAVGCQGTSDTHAGVAYQAQVGISSTKIGPQFNFSSSISEVVIGMNPAPLIRRSIPEGTQLQVRSRSNGTSALAMSFILHGVA